MKIKKAALVYDWIDKWGGVERVLLTLHEMFPGADFFTSYYDSKGASWAKELKIKTSFIQKLPDFIKKNRILSLPFYPYAFESFDLRSYDLVISVTSSFAKSVITRPETLHICYLLTPTRFLWSSEHDYQPQGLFSVFSKPMVNHLKRWDFVAAQRPDHIATISETAAQRCTKYYQRDSDVIYPPFDIFYWSKIKNKISNIKYTNQKLKNMINNQYFLLVSRLEPYKKVNLVIKTFNESPQQHLVIVGKGSQLNKLKKMAKQNISFIDYISDEELASLYSTAQALIMPQEEDFGYVALEAQFFGCPVISFNQGGGTETVIDGKTGIFFDVQSEESISLALERFEKIEYNLRKNTQELGAEQVEKFSKTKFKDNLLKYIDSRGFLSAKISYQSVKIVFKK